jgi:hypothetical protein
MNIFCGMFVFFTVSIGVQMIASYGWEPPNH